MYKSVPKRMQNYIREIGQIRHTTYAGWERSSDHLNTPYKLEYVRSIEDDGIGSITEVNRIAECYVIVDAAKIVVSQLRLSNGFAADLPYKIFFMQLAMEHLIFLAKEMGVKELIVESDMEHITEAMLELEFSIRQISKRSGADSPIETAYQGTKEIE
jgi:hypothetical protein